jgi:hypothetical protein
MTCALAYKELRESAGVAGLGLAALALVALSSMGLSPVSGVWSAPRYGAIPFLYDSFHEQFGLAGGLLAIMLGFKQSVGDFLGDAQLFLFHRPVSRARIYGIKLIIGLGLCLTLSGLAVLAYAAWAATPGTHASPFLWNLTAPTWTAWLSLSLVYLGAFLSGIRPAAWLGTRLAPLAAALGLALLLTSLPVGIAWAWLGLLACDVLFVVGIVDVTANRDFA